MTKWKVWRTKVNRYHRYCTLVAYCSIFVIKLVNWKRNRSRTCYKENKWLLEVMRSIFRELKTLRCRSVHLNQLPPHCRNFVSLEYMICSEQVSMTVLIFDRSSTPLLLHSVCGLGCAANTSKWRALVPHLLYATTFIPI